MLSIGNLGAAAFVTGYALLLAPGLAEAVTIKLDGTGEEAPLPLKYALETLGENTPIDNTVAYHLRSPGGPGSEELKLAVSAIRRIVARDSVYLRLKLREGMVFSGKQRRASARLGLDAHPGDIRVATVLNNLVDGSTDTVVYPSVPGTEL